MLILISLFVLLVVGNFIQANTIFGSFSNSVGFMMTSAGGLLLVVGLIFIPVHRMTVHSKIEEYHSIQQTLDRARGGEVLESAAFQLKVAEANQWRASVQYWNGTAFSLWIPDRVMDLEPIE